MRTFAIIRLAIVAALATVVAQPAVKAQSPRAVAVANIPFAFQIGSCHLAPGTYRLEIQEGGLLWVKGDSGAAVMMVLTDSAKNPSPNGTVVFHHYGNQYFLREVRSEGSQDVLWSAESRAERRAKLEEDALNPNSGPREDAKVEVALLSPPR